MTDADTTAAAGTDPVTTLVAGVGLIPDPSVVDSDSLVSVGGPLLTTDIVDGSGSLVGAVAVFDDPDQEPEELLTALAGAAARVAGGQPREAGAVADGRELVGRFVTPTLVSAFGDGTQIRALHVSAVDRRGSTEGVAGAAAGAGANASAAAMGSASADSLVGSFDKLVNVALDVSVELGRTRVTLAEVMAYDVGTVVELDRAAGAPVDIRVNETLLAQGEVVLIDDEYAVRITAIFDPNQSP